MEKLLWTAQDLDGDPAIHHSCFFELMFNPGDSVIFKPDTFAKLEDCIIAKAPVDLKQLLSRPDAKQWFVIRNPLVDNPKSMGEVSVASFRNFYFEQDKDENGEKYSGVEGKRRQLQNLVDSGLRVSYVIDAGGKSLHFGLCLIDEISLEEHRRLYREIAARLPGNWDDENLEAASALERVPDTIRHHDDGRREKVRLVYTSNRIALKDIREWLERTPPVREVKQQNGPIAMEQIDGDWQTLAKNWCKERGAKIKSVHDNKMVVQCFKSSHKRGDKSASAVIFSNGTYHCSGCGHKDFILKKAIIPKLLNELKCLDDVERPQTAYSTTDKDALLKATSIGSDNPSPFTDHFIVFMPDNLEKIASIIASLFKRGLKDSLLLKTRHGFQLYLFLPVETEKLSIMDALNPILGDATIGFTAFDIEGLEHGTLFRIYPSLEIEVVAPTSLLTLIDYLKEETDLRIHGYLSGVTAPQDDGDLRYQRMLAYEAEMDDRIRNAKEPPDWERKKLGTLMGVDETTAIAPSIGNSIDQMIVAGLSLEAIFNQAKHREMGPKNFPKTKKLLKILNQFNSRVTPIISNTYKIENDDFSCSLNILYTVIDGGVARVIAINMPAGSGKTRFVKNELASNVHHFGTATPSRYFSIPELLAIIESSSPSLKKEWDQHLNKPAARSVSILVNRVKDGAEMEGHITQVVDEQFELQCQPNGSTEIGVYHPESLTKMDVDHIETDDNEEIAQVRFVSSYNKNICLKDNVKAALASICDGCKLTQCHAHRANKIAAEESNIVVGCHQSFFFDQTAAIKSYRKKPRDLIVFDEKPSFVFKSCSTQFSSNRGWSFEKEFPLHFLDEKGKEFISYLSEKMSQRYRDAKKALEHEKTGQWLSEAKGFTNEKRKIDIGIQKIITSIKRNRSELPQDEYYKALDLATSLQILGEDKLIAKFYKYSDGRTALEYHWGYNYWHLITQSPSRVLLFDATAEYDPDYCLPNAPHITQLWPETNYKNLKLKLYSERDMSRTKIDKLGEDFLPRIDKLVAAASMRNGNVLVITQKDQAGELMERYKDNPKVHVDYHGNIHGKNDYRDCTSVIFTHIHRLQDTDYLTRAYHLFPQEKILKNKWQRTGAVLNAGGQKTMQFITPEIENFRLQKDVVELIQCIKRTALRSDQSADVEVWLPTTNLGLIGKLLNYFHYAECSKSLIFTQ